MTDNTDHAAASAAAADRVRVISRAHIVSAARAWLGTPYHHQASLRAVGCDCLGLVRGVWRDVVGPEREIPPPYTRDWAESSSQETLLAAAHRHLVAHANRTTVGAGDVIVFRHRADLPAKHVAIATGSAAFIHAIETAPVSEVALCGWWRRRIAGVFSFPGVID